MSLSTKNIKANIPKQIRKSLNARFEGKEILLEAAGKAPGIYAGALEDELHTRKGFWRKYVQPNHEIPYFLNQSEEKAQDRFCAVYFRGKRPLTIIQGDTADNDSIDNLLKTVSKKIIEQIPIISFPNKSLTEENGLTYGLRVGLIIAILFAVFVLFDYMLIPNYPEAFLQGANISMGEDVNTFSADSKIFQYTSLTKKIVEHFFPVKYRHLSASMYTLAAIFILPVLFFGIVYEIAGRLADRIRVKRFPKEALEFKYGTDAVEAVIKESEIVHNETTKQELFTRLSGHGLDIEKTEFARIFSELIR